MFAKGNAFLGFWYSRLFFEPPHGVWQGYGCEEHGIFKGNACAKVVKELTLTDNKSNSKRSSYQCILGVLRKRQFQDL